MTPLYKHDCDLCIFLGTEDIYNHGKFDLYVCEKESFIEYIARYSSDSPDYICMSSLVFSGDTMLTIHPAIRICELKYEIHKSIKNRLKDIMDSTTLCGRSTIDELLDYMEGKCLG